MVNYILALTDLGLTILVLLVSSYLIRYSFILNKQYWIKTKTLLLSSLLLPIITFVITKVISGNLALSLGMVGALSIVRFRNPVKSPLELVLYFTLITLGISASVNIQWTIILSFVVIFINAMAFIYENFLVDKFGMPKFLTSFSEGNPLSTLEVSLDQEINFLSKKNSFSSLVHHDNTYIYRFASPNIAELNEILEEVKSNNLDPISFNIQKF
tara:strand:+ start:345 stop:986 length:642 start_codon:yes stop_codon:yes gene_type:complete